ncbi:MAG: enoyl-CoA hydratase [Deltaproteobacteria bacterium]|nr:enoyl-CoA hydratase [Deltaproteobacteria bacterium]
MTYEQILYEVRDRIAMVTLNRPERLNAWTPVMEREVRAAMTEATADEKVRVIILTGAGRGFCSGADMSGLNQASQSTAKSSSLTERLAATRAEAYASGPIKGGLDLPQAFSYRHAYFPTVPKPIIAALNGPTAGVGLIVALYADVRFASQASVFTTAFARRGLVAEHGIDWILPRIVGLPNAIDLLLSARKITAEEALQIGLVNKVFPQESFMSEVRAYALELAQMVSPRSMRVMKTQLFRAQTLDFGAALHASIPDVVESLHSEDFKEGVAHFVEKRAPNFPGR